MEGATHAHHRAMMIAGESVEVGHREWRVGCSVMEEEHLPPSLDEGALTTESVERASLTLQRVHDVHGGDGLATGVLGVRDGIADDMLEEDLEHSTSLLVDESADALHTAAARETTDGRLGDALDVVAQDLAVTLGAALAETLTALAATRHVEEEVVRR